MCRERTTPFVNVAAVAAQAGRPKLGRAAFDEEGTMGLLGVLLAVGLLIALAYRGWSILLLAPAAALVVAAFAREPLLAHWTQTFMSSTAKFIAQFFPLFLLGALFGKLMDDSGSVKAIARFIVERLGPRHAVLAIVLAGAVVTYGGVSLFVAFFVLAPMAQEVFRAADIPRRLMPAAIALGTVTFTMSAAPGTPAIQNAAVMPFLGTTLFAAPGLGAIASVIMLGFGLGWLRFVERRARRAGEGFGDGAVGSSEAIAADSSMRERATTAREFDPAEMGRGQRSATLPPVGLAALPLVVVVGVNLLMAWLILPRLDAAYLAEKRWGATSLSAVGGVWSVVVALAAAIAVLLLTSHRRLPALRDSVDAGANAAVLPALTVASLVGFGAVVAAVPAFGSVRNVLLSTGRGVLIPLAVSTNVLSALTGTAAGSLTITFQTLGDTLLRLSAEQHIDHALLHRVATIGAGTLDSLPHNGAIAVLLAVCGATHRESYWNIAAVAIIGPAIALVTVIGLGTTFGSF
jgi:H+/gluconate symporter-like permease